MRRLPRLTAWMLAARASFIAAHALGWRLYDRSLMNHLGYSPQDSINSLLRSRVGGQDDTSKTKEASQEDASGVVLGSFFTSPEANAVAGSARRFGVR